MYRDVHVAVLPARYEAFGYVALEAMACGIPAVGFNNTGTAEVCANGETALLTETDDIRALIKSCVFLFENRNTLRQMGGRSRRRAVEIFSEPAAVSEYITIYNALI